MKTTAFLLIIAVFSGGILTSHQLFISKNENTKPDSVYHVYITIDDGPSAGTININDIVIASDIPVTVFPIGKNVYKNDSSINLFNHYAQNPLIEIGNHSFSHANGHYRQYYSHPEDVLNDFKLNYDTCHLTVKAARLPGRNTWRINGRKRTDLADDTASANLLQAAGYSVFGWDIEWRCDADSGSANAANEMFKAVKRMLLDKGTFTPGHVVILFHDSCFADSSNRYQLDLFIKELKSEERYRFEKLSNYP